LKNIESDSVTQVRLGKANELNSIAALNNAKAQAEVIMANAQAALIQAEAKIKEAQVAKIAAETQYQLIENQIRELDIRLKEIAIESAQYDLLVKKAEYEKVLAELKVAQAKAEKQLAQYAFELQQIQNAMQIDALKASKAVLEAELAYLKQIEANEQEERAFIQQIANRYFALQSQNLSLQISIQENNIAITALEAGMKDPEAVYEEEIAKNQNMINFYQACMDKIAEYATEMTEEQFYEYLAKAITTLIEAQNTKATLYQAFMNAIDDEAEAAADLGLVGEGGSMYRQGIAENQINFTYEGEEIDALAFAGVSAATDFTYIDDEGNQHVLFEPEQTEYDAVLFYPSIDDEELEAQGLDPRYYINKAENHANWANTRHARDWRNAPGFFSIYWIDEVTPASINVEGFEVAFNEILDDKKDEVNTQKEWWKGWHEMDIAFQDAWINQLQAKYDAEYAYVKSLEPKYEKVESDLTSTAQDYIVALDKVQRAEVALENAMIAGAAPVQEAYAKYEDALTKYNTARDEHREARRDVARAGRDLRNKEEGVINHILTADLYVNNPEIDHDNFYYPYLEGVIPATTIREVYEAWIQLNGGIRSIALDDRYNKIRELQLANINDWKSFIDILVQKWEDLKTDYEAAEEAFTEAMGAYEEKVLENTDLYNEYVTALVEYEADPTDENAAALEEAYNNWKDMEAKVAGNIHSNTVVDTDGEYVKAVQAARAAFCVDYQYDHTLIELYDGIYGMKGTRGRINTDILGNRITEDGDLVRANKALIELESDAFSAEKNHRGDFRHPYSTAAVQELVDNLDEAIETLETKANEREIARAEKDENYDAWQAAIDKVAVDSPEAQNLLAANNELNGYEDEEGEHVKGAIEKWQDAYTAFEEFLATYVFEKEYDIFDEPLTSGTNYLAIVWDLNEMNPFGLGATLKAAKDRRETTISNYDLILSGLDEEVTDLEAKIDACLAHLTKMEETYKPAYVELVTAYNNAVIATMEAKFALDASDFFVKSCETIYAMIASIPYETMKDANGDTVYVAEYYRAYLAQQMAIYAEANQKAIAQKQTNWNNSKAILWLKNQNSIMESQIAINEVLMADYAKILEDWAAGE
jgi:hypothetical protein